MRVKRDLFLGGSSLAFGPVIPQPLALTPIL